MVEQDGDRHSPEEAPATDLPYGSEPPEQVLETVLESVLQFLTSRRDRNAASQVCRSWHRAEALTRSELFIGNCYAVSPARAAARFPRVRSIYIKGRPRFSDSILFPRNWGAHFRPWVSAMARSYPWLEKVHLKRMSLTNDDLALLAGSFRQLNELELVLCDGFSTKGLCEVASKCRQLRVLEVSTRTITENTDDWMSCFPVEETCLESLIFDHVECEINFEALERLVARSPLLKKLRLNSEVSTRQLCRLLIKAPQLTHLGTGFFSSDEDIQQVDDNQELDYLSAFASCKSLVCLSVFQLVEPNYLPAIYPVCSNLTSLNFSDTHINPQQFSSVIVHCHKLQTLRLLDSVRDEGLQAAAATCKDLRELRVLRDLGIKAPVSEIGLQALSEGCKKLQSILYFCQRMTNEAVIAMSRSCPDLAVFRLCIMDRHQPDSVTGKPMDEGFGAIVKNCRKITRLAVSGLVTDKAFWYIGQYGKLIRNLSLGSASDSDMGLRFILEGCPRLQKLEIRDSPFGDAALRAGAHRYYDMRFLWMFCCRVSRRVCEEIARSMPHLVVELLRYKDGDDSDNIWVLYMYRSLEPSRNDAPKSVTIL